MNTPDTDSATSSPAGRPVPGAPAAAGRAAVPAGADPGSPSPPVAAARLRQRRRRVWLAGALAGFAALALGYGLYWERVMHLHQTTDDAYVAGNVVQITPQISGTVIAIGADDTQFVRAGQPLVRLDQADQRVALDEAEAQLARTVRDVRNLFATSAELQAAVDMRATDLASAQSDLARRERLGSSGAISAEVLQHARDAVRTAQAALVAARQQLAANRARVDGTTIEDHPAVRAAAAAVRSALLAYARTRLPAPVSGFVARRNVQLGEQVSPGTPLMAVVPLDQVWVDANFKEPQLARMRAGQPARLTADLYGRDVVFHGTVAGFGAGTGAAFALLPAQNATGNWIKIVQRVPVRIALDAQEVAAHPLQIGLSMKVDVDVSDEAGSRLPQVASLASGWSTPVFDSGDARADARVHAIIAANERGARTAARALNAPQGGRNAARVAAHALLVSAHPSGNAVRAP